jgi:hypothetical protein
MNSLRQVIAPSTTATIYSTGVGLDLMETTTDGSVRNKNRVPTMENNSASPPPMAKLNEQVTIEVKAVELTDVNGIQKPDLEPLTVPKHLTPIQVAEHSPSKRIYKKKTFQSSTRKVETRLPSPWKKCHVHTPTLTELCSQSFSNYVRTTVLASASLMVSCQETNNNNSYESWRNTPELPLKHGMAKVVLPRGFWQERGIACDRTGRGPAWQAGQPLGDYVLPSPIQQNLNGLAGIYEYTFVDKQSMTIADFRDKADHYRVLQVGCAVDIDENDSVDLATDKCHDKETNAFIKVEGDAETVSQLMDAEKNERMENAANLTNAETSTTATGSTNHLNGKAERNRMIPIDHLTPKEGDELTAEERRECRLVELDRLFWKRLGPTMPPAWYAADHEGSFFGDDPASGWSLKSLDTCLHLLGSVPGVTTPYLYMGMFASTFAAHCEDVNLMSINYLHAGAPKIWYAIAPGPDGARFEALAAHHYSHVANDCKEFLRHKQSLLSPKLLKKAGIAFTTIIQYPGEAVITFPGGYHFGFNTGFNVAEATNFGVPEWIPFGLRAKHCLCRPDSVRIDMRRFISILHQYEAYQRRQRKKGRQYRTYREWARDREKEREKSTEGFETNGSMTKAERKALSEQERNNEFWVEVINPLQSSGRGVGENVRKNKKHKSSSVMKKQAQATWWHLAKPTVSRKKLQVGSKVLILLPVISDNIRAMPRMDDSSDDEAESEVEDEQCYSGEVTEIMDEHARVHLHGLTRSEDVWQTLASSKLFLDGGRWEDHVSTEVLPELHYWKEQDSKKLCPDD